MRRLALPLIVILAAGCAAGPLASLRHQNKDEWTRLVEAAPACGASDITPSQAVACQDAWQIIAATDAASATADFLVVWRKMLVEIGRMQPPAFKPTRGADPTPTPDVADRPGYGLVESLQSVPRVDAFRTIVVPALSAAYAKDGSVFAKRMQHHVQLLNADDPVSLAAFREAANDEAEAAGAPRPTPR